LLSLSGVALADAAEFRSAAVAPVPQQDAEDDEVRLAPVEVDGQRLFMVRGSTSLPADERAALNRGSHPRAGPRREVRPPPRWGARTVGGGTRIAAPDAGWC
jgi:hypothetical protein